jgi:hypothetical protein
MIIGGKIIPGVAIMMRDTTTWAIAFFAALGDWSSFSLFSLISWMPSWISELSEGKIVSKRGQQHQQEN